MRAFHIEFAVSLRLIICYRWHKEYVALPLSYIPMEWWESNPLHTDFQSKVYCCEPSFGFLYISDDIYCIALPLSYARKPRIGFEPMTHTPQGFVCCKSSSSFTFYSGDRDSEVAVLFIAFCCMSPHKLTILYIYILVNQEFLSLRRKVSQP